MDYVGVTGLVVSVAGFGVAIWQLTKTQAAAEAARDSAREAVQLVRQVESVSDIQEICGRSRDLLHLTRARNLASAANAAFELRDATARYRVDFVNGALIAEGQWNAILSEVAAVHQRLESSAVTNRLSAEEREQLIHDIARLHSQFSGLSARAAQAATSGTKNANS